MAEAAGLVVGGVALLGLFDSCLSALDRIDAGKQYGRDYQRTALQISLLQLRLSRWKASVHFEGDELGVRHDAQVASADEAKQVLQLLGHIKDDLDTAEEKWKHHKLHKAPEADAGAEPTTMDALCGRVRKLALTRQKQSSFAQKTRWALEDGKKFAHLVEYLEGNVSSLVTLFPAVEPTQRDLAVRDLARLADPAGLDRPEDAARILREASAGVDPQLVAAMERVALAKSGYSFNKMSLHGNAMGQYGTYFAPGQYQADHKAIAAFIDVTASGYTRAHYGDNLGGDYLLGADFHRQVHEQRGPDVSAGAQGQARR